MQQFQRLRRILDVAAACENEVVILGAFGCGAFKNKPEVVALAAKNVLKDYRKAFETIEFAVYSTPRDEGNYKTFARVLHSLKKYITNISKYPVRFYGYCVFL